jgi:hypothetical protein
MKKLLLLSILLHFFSLQSQVQTTKSMLQTIEPGVYTGQTGGQNIKLLLTPDKKFDMSFFFGDYQMRNDSIIFNNATQKTPKFSLKPVADAEYSSTLQIDLSYELANYYQSEIYIGTQDDENRKVAYKPLKDYLTTDDYSATAVYNMQIAKAKYLFITESRYDKTTVFKFQIPENVHRASLEYLPYGASDLKLRGYIDPSTNKLAISDGKSPVLFNFEKENSQLSKKDSSIVPISENTAPNWRKDNGFEDDTVVAEVYAPPYVFKHVISNNFSSALSEIKNKSNKFLVLCYDPKNKNAKTEFESFINTSEESISSYMYSEYNPSYDHFNFYLASDSDKKILTKNNVKSEQEIVVFNAEGEMIYHTKGSINDKKDLFSIYNSIHKDLSAANEKLALDKLVNNKSAAVNDIKAALRKTSTSETVYATIAPPVLAVDAVKFDPPVVIKEEVKTDEPVVIEEKVSYETTVDSAAYMVPPAYEDNYYDLIKDKENLYTFKSNKEAVMAKWRKVLDTFKNSKNYDKEFVQIIKAELTNTGFTNKLFPKANYNSTDLDFELLDYVFANYKMLLEPPVEKVAEAVKEEGAVIAEYEPYYYEQDIKTVINSHLSYANFPENPQIEKVLKYYKKHLEISGFDATAVQNYLYALKQNIEIGTNKKEYLETYEKYFNSIVNKNTSIIENLDAAFSVSSDNDYGNWTGYKNAFANLANDVSWYLVEKSNDAAYLAKAIKWSETSLIIEKNNHYYLDTLAQIYYKNGMKQKAIETEQKAIDANNDGDNSEYKLVLEKMKNGTY